MTAAAAEGKLPDVVGGAVAGRRPECQNNELLNTEMSGDIVETLGPETFTERALTLTQDGDTQLGVPQRRVGAAAALPQGSVRRGRARGADHLRHHRKAAPS